MIKNTNFHMKDLCWEEKNYFGLLYFAKIFTLCTGKTMNEMIKIFEPDLHLLKGCGYLLATSVLQRDVAEFASKYNIKIDWEKFFKIDKMEVVKEINVLFYEIFFKNIEKDNVKLYEYKRDINDFLENGLCEYYNVKF